ncbi:MAG TPA: helix-turn-helix domain-containing protein [Magnetospirillum sp.]|nr:helix-turn-helix domain-containing protein [Magnetospirillum sp.]
MKELLAEMQLKDGWTVEETAVWSGIGRTTLYKEIKAHRLIARKCGDRTIIRREEAIRWMASLPPARS